MLELIGAQTQTKYYIMPQFVSSFHEAKDGGVYIFTNRVKSGTTVTYHVQESIEEILMLMELYS